MRRRPGCSGSCTVGCLSITVTAVVEEKLHPIRSEIVVGVTLVALTLTYAQTQSHKPSIYEKVYKSGPLNRAAASRGVVKSKSASKMAADTPLHRQWRFAVSCMKELESSDKQTAADLQRLLSRYAGPKRELVNYRWTPDHASREGTALHLAVQRGCTFTVKFLLSAGADIFSTLSVRASCSLHAVVMATFVQIDSRSMTALDCARSASMRELLALHLKPDQLQTLGQEFVKKRLRPSYSNNLSCVEVKEVFMRRLLTVSPNEPAQLTKHIRNHRIFRKNKCSYTHIFPATLFRQYGIGGDYSTRENWCTLYAICLEADDLSECGTF